MTRIYLTRECDRLIRKAGLSDASLREAVSRGEEGLVDATLGRFLVKQRVARPGGGRSGGHRAILFLKVGETAVFLHLFAKNAVANLRGDELDAYREFAKLLAGLHPDSWARLIDDRRWREISNG